MQVILGLILYLSQRKKFDLFLLWLCLAENWLSAAGPDFAGGGPGANIEDGSSLFTGAVDRIKDLRTGRINTTNK